MEVLKSALSPKLKNFDFVLIDCPPNLGFITQNGIEISDYYLIPTIPDTLSTYGIPQIVKKIHDLSVERNLKIKCLGLVITKYSTSSNAHARGKRSLPARFENIFEELSLEPAPIFATVMPQANQTAEAMEFGGGSTTFRMKYGYSKSGNQSLYEYVVDLTKEFLRNVGE